VAENHQKEQGNRLKKLRKALGKTQVQFAEEVDATQALISAIEHGNRNISNKMVQAIMLAYPNINMDWLLNGRGNIIIDPEAAKPQTGAIALLADDLEPRLRGSDAEEPGGGYAATQADLDKLRRRIKRLEQFIAKKFTDFTTD
jgi:transcriptional regulator with XRE-family HTH domain